MAVLQCIPPLCELLTVQDARVINVGLEGLANILNQGEKDKETREFLTSGAEINEFARLVTQADAVDKIEALQNHANDEVSRRAASMLEGLACLWTKITLASDGRSYYSYQGDTGGSSIVSRESPGCMFTQQSVGESDEDIQRFESEWERAGKMDAGEIAKINPQSKWVKFAYQGRCFFQVKGSKPLMNSLKPPAEGVRREQEVGGKAQRWIPA